MTVVPAFALVVEDDVLQRETLSNFLEKANMDAIQCENQPEPMSDRSSQTGLIVLLDASAVRLNASGTSSCPPTYR
jgi:DNA-binding response OmpR family regulator